MSPRRYGVPSGPTCLLQHTSPDHPRDYNNVHPGLFIPFQVLAVFIFLIVGFALSFSVVFHENDQFRNFWTAIVKTMVMMTGEYEYADLFEKKTDENSSLLLTGQVLFLAFIMLVGISLMNLMIGLAVNDIQDLEKQVRNIF